MNCPLMNRSVFGRVCGACPKRIFVQVITSFAKDKTWNSLFVKIMYKTHFDLNNCYKNQNYLK